MTTEQFIFAALGLGITLLSILITLALGVYQMKKKFQWDKIMVVHQLCQAWTDKTSPHRKIIEKTYGTYFVGFKPITPPPAEALTHATDGDELFPIKTAVISLMNYFEDVAVLYSTGMADRSTLNTLLRRPLMLWYDKIKPLAQCFDKVTGLNNWKPVDDLIAKWKKEDSEAGTVKPVKFA